VRHPWPSASGPRLAIDFLWRSTTALAQTVANQSVIALEPASPGLSPTPGVADRLKWLRKPFDPLMSANVIASPLQFLALCWQASGPAGFEAIHDRRAGSSQIPLLL